MTHPAPIPPRHDRLIASAVIIASMAAALAIRILWPYDTVFMDGNVWFREMDSWYRMRLVDNFLQNFPLVTAFDPYSNFPHGIRAAFHPLTSWLIGVPALILGGGNPSPELIDKCGAYFPPILGALTVIPVYFIGRLLHGRLAGAVAAILIAVLPGEFLSRSLLGFTDHHVTEAFFSAVALLLFMKALREAAKAEVVVRRPSDLANPAYRRVVLFAALAGIALGLYLLAWRGGVFVLAVLVLYTVIRSLMDYGTERAGDDMVLVFGIAGVIALVIASPTIAPHSMSALYVIAMVSVAAFPLILRLLSRQGHRLKLSPPKYVFGLFGCLVLAFIAMLLVSPNLAGYVRGALDFMVPSGAHLSIMEMHPLLLPGGDFSLWVAWTNYSTALAAAIIAIVVLLRSRNAPKGHDVTLFIVWSVTMFVATLLQRRFGYYFAVDVAVLCGFLVGWLGDRVGIEKQFPVLRQHAAVPAKAKGKSATRALQTHRSEQRAAVLKLVVFAAAVAGLLIVPCVDMAKNFATEPGLMTKGWYETLGWLRSNTPEPLDADAYYGLYDEPANWQPFDYPDSAYGVMAWWDYGHWITRLSHRIPVANPFQQGARTASRFLTAQVESDGAALLEENGCDYVVVDSKTAVRTFNGVASWAGQRETDYYDVYLQRDASGTWQPIMLFYPEYYQTMLVRLYNFGGESFAPEEYTVIRRDPTPSGNAIKNQVADVRRFATHEEALAFIAQASDADWRLVGTNPFKSAVPLEALQGFAVAYESEAQSFVEANLLPEVRVFRFTG